MSRTEQAGTGNTGFEYLDGEELTGITHIAVSVTIYFLVITIFINVFISFDATDIGFA